LVEYYTQGLSSKEIARLTGTNASNARSRWRRLKMLLGQQGVGNARP